MHPLTYMGGGEDTKRSPRGGLQDNLSLAQLEVKMRETGRGTERERGRRFWLVGRGKGKSERRKTSGVWWNRGRVAQCTCAQFPGAVFTLVFTLKKRWEWTEESWNNTLACLSSILFSFIHTFFHFQSRRSDSIRGFVRPSVGGSVGGSVGRSVTIFSAY